MEPNEANLYKLVKHCLDNNMFSVWHPSDKGGCVELHDIVAMRYENGSFMFYTERAEREIESGEMKDGYSSYDGD